ncbi:MULTISPECIES: DNA-directed RNA polymerase subunit omega [unclassified Roseitalea]|uniref:DNA-directed RNA polymerase subunit omega n=1 Tax=unclassified Roseitalea TaxID=2639107 RepID=UPI00273E2A4F|nr:MULTISPECIES: DNA-directed RNA polymerase subunit omega [unclassified Roseitalea]
MARITVDDCLTAVPNRFELVMLAAHRARAVHHGAPTDDPEPHHKATVTALREFALGRVDPEEQRESLITALRRHLPDEEPETEDIADEAEFASMMAPISDDAEGEKDAA